jgi:hypothetical protein
MTTYQQKDNSGSIFKNDRKESANHPDAKGSCMIDGVEYWISSWNKKTQDGKDWRSLAFQRKDRQEPRQEAPAYRKPSQDAAKARQVAPKRDTAYDPDQDVPF